MSKMNPKIKRKWLRDLRTHRQTTDSLVSGDQRSHCCLGRLAVVLGCKFDLGGYPIRGGQRFSSSSVLPQVLLDEAGINTTTERTLTSINDASRGFAKVIEYIKDNL